jgi:hypothetical protein
MEKVLRQWHEQNIYEELSLNVGLQKFLNKGVPIDLLGRFVCEMAADYCDAHAEMWAGQLNFRREGVKCVDCGTLRPGVYRAGTIVATVTAEEDP